jgi:hypothetical protein
VIGIVVLMERHRRDADAIAARHGVGVGAALPAGVETRRVVRFPGWHEIVLWLPDRRLLVSAAVLGTIGYFLAAGSASTRSFVPSRRGARSTGLPQPPSLSGTVRPSPRMRPAPFPRRFAPPAPASPRPTATPGECRAARVGASTLREA